MLKCSAMIVLLLCCRTTTAVAGDGSFDRDSALGRSATGLPIVPKTTPRNVLDSGDSESVDALRSQGFVFVDRITGESIREISPCIYEVAQKLSDGQLRRSRVEVGCLIAPNVTASVTRLPGGYFRYTYTLMNRRSAEQQVYGFWITLPAPDAIAASAESHGWRPAIVSTPASNRAMWRPLGGAPLLGPGQTVEGLSITSEYWPGITDAVFAGAARDRILDLVEEPSDALDAALAAIYQKAKVSDATIGPVIPAPIVSGGAGSVLDRVDNDIAAANTRGWISDPITQTLHEVVADARLASPGELNTLADKVNGLHDANPSYRHALAATLRALAE